MDGLRGAARLAAVMLALGPGCATDGRGAGSGGVAGAGMGATAGASTGQGGATDAAPFMSAGGGGGVSGARSTADASPATAGSGPGAGPVRSRESLVDHDAWTVVAAGDDPFASERPATATCDAERGYGAEAFDPADPPDASFFVSTLYCDYLTVEQPTRVPIVAGDAVVLRLWQSALLTPDGATVHLAVGVGADLSWEQIVPIPAEAWMLRKEWVAVTDMPAGSPVRFHLHNHGANEYSLLELSTGPSD